MIRLLLLADTHLGLGENHSASFERALAPAFAREVDLVVHGGDVFFRSRVKPGVVLRAFEPLKRIADSGVPVVVVPGNHERSASPYPILAMHPRIHIFDRPQTFAVNVRGVDVAIAGFPCERNGIEGKFGTVLEQTGWRTVPAAVRLLCFHQTVEGATVGPADFVFRRHPDVIPGRAIPSGFTAVLAGHIHRHQVLSGRGFAAPVFYPGSTERTSGAERGEAKGYVTMELSAERVEAWTFHEMTHSTASIPRTSPTTPPTRRIASSVPSMYGVAPGPPS